MGIHVELKNELGLIAQCSDPRGDVPKFLVLAETSSTACLQFIDWYGDTVFNYLQLPVLESEIKAALPALSLDRLKTWREQMVADAIRARWQPVVIERLRLNLGDASSRSAELEQVREHMNRVLDLLARARDEARPHVRFIGD